MSKKVIASVAPMAAALTLAAAPVHRSGAKDADPDPAGTPDIAKQVTELGEKMASAIDTLKEDMAKLKTDTGDKSKSFDDFKTQVDEKLTGVSGVADQLKAIEQKLARGNGSPEAKKSIGQKFAESDGVKSLAANRTSGGRVSMEFEGILGQKDITSATADAAGSAGALVVPDRRGLVDQPRRRLTVRGLMNVTQTASASIEYERLKLDQNNAAPFAEGSAPAQTELQFEDKTATVVDIGHFARASRNILDDAPRLQSFIEGRLSYGLSYQEELQLLLGSGTGGNLEGLVTAAAAYAAPFTIAAGVTKMDILRLALLQAVTGEYFPTGMVLNHIDWAGIELTKDSTGQYVIGQPQGELGARMWGQPVVNTNAMTADEFLVGDFSMGAEIADRMQSTVEASTEDGDNFRTRKVTLMAVERVAMPIYHPGAFITGDFSDAIAATTTP